MSVRPKLARRAKTPRVVKAVVPRFVHSSKRHELGEESSESEDEDLSDYFEGVVDSDTEFLSEASDTEDEAERAETEDEADNLVDTEDEAERAETEDEADNLVDTEDEAERPETEDEAGRPCTEDEAERPCTEDEAERPYTHDEADNLYDTDDKATKRLYAQDKTGVPANYVFCNRELRWFHPDCFSARELKNDFPQSLRNSCHYYTTTTMPRGTPSGGLKTWVGYNSATKRNYVEMSEACPFRDSNAVYYDDKTSGIKRLASQLNDLENKYRGR
jgi:hypothetical protein